jgi:hypothetical protein
VLVCNGVGSIADGVNINTCEVINLESPAKTCQNLPNFPVPSAFLAIGGLGVKNNPIICGGVQNRSAANSCYSLENGAWVSSESMNSARVDAAAVLMEDGQLLVTGGDDGQDYTNSAEMLTDKGCKTEVPSLPVTIANHCMVQVNSTTVMAVGGFQNDNLSGNTFYFNTEIQSWTQGPALKMSRHSHRCGRIRKSQNSNEMSIIVVGGFNLASAEILDEGSNEWRAGPAIQFGTYYSEMVNYPKGGVVMIGGQAENNNWSNTLYQLSHGGNDAVWTEMKQKLTTGRNRHTAFLIPDNIVSCA